MPHKRSLEPETTLEGSARKRRYLGTSSPTTPAPSRLFLSTPLKTPYTPYPSHPSDSPTNPFGRKRIPYLIRTLPHATRFSKHLPLRFQLIRRGSSPRQGGVYRIVQVPLSYTLAHLRCLVSFLFGGRPVQEVIDEHLFEVKKDVSMYSQLYKPGQVKSGQTWAKLSSSKNPYRYRLEYFSDGEESCSESERDDQEQSEDEEFEDWKWEDEEEFTIGHVWSKGFDSTRAIVYHHSRTTQIHITINQSVLPKRTGKSNTPYVFSARGRVWLSPLPFPQLVFSITPKKEISQENKSHRPRDFIQIEDDDTEGDTEEEEEEEYECAEDLNLELEPDSWNNPKDSFAKFLARYMGSAPKSSSPRSSAQFDDDVGHLSEEGESLVYHPSTPGLTRSSSVPSSPLPASSSPRTLPHVQTAGSSSDLEADEEAEERIKDEGGYVTLSLPALTPFPPKARPIRKRMERVERRMGKMKNGKWLCARDEKPEEEDEKDELAEDDDDDEENEDAAFFGAVAEGEENVPEDWDPFGEEEEL